MLGVSFLSSAGEVGEGQAQIYVPLLKSRETPGVAPLGPTLRSAAAAPGETSLGRYGWATLSHSSAQGRVQRGEP